LAFALQDIPSASTGPATTPSQGAPAGATTSADGAPPADSGLLGSPFFMLMMFVPLIIMMLWSSRSQTKRQQKALAELTKGDMVLTQSGIRGKLIELGDRYAKVEIAPGTKIEVLKTAVLGKDTAEAAAQIEKR
jgi:preprotein translocase subunit YajC